MKSSDLLVIGLLLWIVVGCDDRTPYEKLVDQELKSGVKEDSLFLEFYFGNTREEFFKTGWEKNKKGLIAQGPRNQNVLYIMPNDKMGESPIHMLFFPEFDKAQKIKNMKLTFTYSGWSPWNKKFSSDSLMVALQDTLQRWYGGNEFVQIKLPYDQEESLVKLDGNRLINLSKIDDQYIQGYIKDLNHPDYKKQ